jgi:hypothetical protein
MTTKEIPEEVVEIAAKAAWDAGVSGEFPWATVEPESQEAWRREARAAVAAALPHLRVQETPPAVSAKAVSDVLREFSNGEPVDGDGWVLFADNLDDFHGALVAAGVFAAPRPVLLPTEEDTKGTGS